MKTIQPIFMYVVVACLVFYLFMQIGHYAEQSNLENQYPLVASHIGDPSKWTPEERTVMALVLPKCKNENQSGNFERMKTCWINRAATIKDDGKSSKVLSNLLERNSKKGI